MVEQYHSKTSEQREGVYTYIPGMGFTTMSLYTQIEKQKIRHVASAIGLSMLLFWAMSLFTGQIVTTCYESLASMFGFDYQLNYQASISIYYVLSIISYLFTLIIPTFVCIHMTRLPGHAIFPMRKNRFIVNANALSIGIGASVISMLLAFLLDMLFSTIGFSTAVPQVTEPVDLLSCILYLLYLCVIPAIFEELFFRGVILQALRRFSDGFALLVSSLLFALAHRNLVQGANAFLMGLVIGYLVIRTGNLWVGIGIHFLNNFFGFLSSTLSIQHGLIGQLMLYGGILLLGMISTLMFIRRDKGAFGIASSSSSLSLSTRMRALFSATPIVACMVLYLFILLGNLFGRV